MKFNHVHLICSDLDQMIHFLTDVLGAEYLKCCRFGPADGACLQMNGISLNLRLPAGSEQLSVECPPNNYGYHHIGVEVKDLDAAYEEIAGKGYEFTKKPGMGAAIRNAFFRGPDGIIVELMEMA
jgi:catechol 2,3-dioxygenase-like lactoylglutathione lyase family enzyme